MTPTTHRATSKTPVSKEAAAKPPLRKTAVLVSVLILICVALVLLYAEDTVDVERTAVSPVAQNVSSMQIQTQPKAAVLTSFAEVRPRWSAALRAAVAGRVITVNDGARAGEQIARGDELFRIDPMQYETAVAEARLALAQARFDLIRATNTSDLAKSQYERSGQNPPSDQAIHVPQIRIAELAVTANAARLDAARRQLDETIVRAPFSAFITERFISLGQTVARGDPMVRLIDDTRFTLEVSLDRAEWELLRHPIAGQHTQLFTHDNRSVGIATVRQGGGFLDAKTRQFKVFLDLVPTQGAAPLSGDFLRVVFEGQTITDAFTIPETALTREGFVWLIDHRDMLVRHRPVVLFRDEGTITIEPPLGQSQWTVAVIPLASFLPGQRVVPVAMEE